MTQRRWLVALLVLVSLTACSTTDSPGPATPSPSDPVPPSAGRPVPEAPPSSQPVSPGATVASCPAPADPTRFQAISFNIHSGRGGGRVDLAAVALAIAVSGADVVLLQEVDRFRAKSGDVHQARWLARRLDMDWAYAPGTTYAAAAPGRPAGTIGNAVLSRFPIVERSSAALPRDPGLHRRTAVRAVLELGPERRLAVYSTHFDHTSGAVRIRQAARLRTLIRRDPLPVLVGGDLNAEPGSPALNVLRRDGLADAWETAGSGSGLTVPAGSPRRRIDYLLHGPDLRTRRAAVLESGISDHREVWAELEVPVLGRC